MIMSFILAANNLLKGHVVYWHGAGWTEQIERAQMADDASVFEEIGKAEIAAQNIVDPYAVAVAVTDGKIWPTKFRETVRATGPSVRLDLARK
jgi:hypothetical protein